MEENPKGTPNPLNPNIEAAALDANPSESMGSEPPKEAARPVTNGPTIDSFMNRPANPYRPVDPMIPVNHGPAAAMPTEPVAPKPAINNQPVQPMSTMNAANAVNTTSMPTPEIPNDAATLEAATMGVITDTNGVPTADNDPMNRPMKKAGDEAPKAAKKGKKGLIIGAIICLILALGCGVAAAIVMLNNKKEDVVAVALSRLLAGEAPKNIAIDGTIDISSNDLTSDITDAQISLQSKAVTSSLINQTTASISVNARDGQSFQMGLGEVYAANGDLYIKTDGLNQLIGDDQTDSTALLLVLQALGTADGEWLRISIDELSSVEAETETEIANSSMSCLVDFVEDARNNSNSLIGFYTKNAFITSTTENLTVKAEKNPIYQVNINSDKLAGFLNEAKNNAAFQNLATCTGTDASTIDWSAVSSNLTSMIPEFYVEIDDNYNFTRFYLENDDDDFSVKIDFDFSYPNNVNVPEPTEYKDFQTLLQESLTNTFDLDEIEDGEVVEEIETVEETPAE